MTKPHPTKKSLASHAGRTAYAEAVNLLGCALPHRDFRNFEGHFVEHLLSTVIRFSIACRRWIELSDMEQDSLKINCILKLQDAKGYKHSEIDRFLLAPNSNNLVFALNRIIHSRALIISSPLVVCDKFDNITATELQQRFFSMVNRTPIFHPESEKEMQSIPLISLLDAYFQLLPQTQDDS